MKFSAEILEELKTVSPSLASLAKVNVFSVPEGYFDELSINTLKNIHRLADNGAANLSVPNGYFEDLTSSILDKIKENEQTASQELRSLSPMLYSIQNENVFTVPRGYFNNLENNILDKVTGNTGAKVVEFKKRASIWKYAAAAVVTGIIGLSSILMFNSTSDSNVSKATEESISTAFNTASQFKNEQQVTAAIASLSDEEIIKYLERTGTDVDGETLTNNVDATELPEPTDYLLEENTLNSILKNNTDN